MTRMKMLALAYFYAASMQDKWVKFLQLLMMTRTKGRKGARRTRRLQLVFDMCTWPANSRTPRLAMAKKNVSRLLSLIHSPNVSYIFELTGWKQVLKKTRSYESIVTFKIFSIFVYKIIISMKVFRWFFKISL